MGKIGIHFGAFAPPILEQLINQQVVKIPDNINLYQKYADSVLLLSVHQILSESEVAKARKRIVKKIGKEL